MRAFLTKAKPVTKPAAAKDEIRTGVNDFETRTLQDVPSQHATHDDLEIPATHSLAVFAFERDEFRASGLVALVDDYLIQSRADIRTGIALQRPQQIRVRNHISPGGVRAG